MQPMCSPAATVFLLGNTSDVDWTNYVNQSPETVWAARGGLDKWIAATMATLPA
eukprot:SAG31_NODE_476_length_15154_cov_24.796878_12_plen_54_part_00